MRKTVAVMLALAALTSGPMGTAASAQQAPSIELGAQPLPHQFPPAPPANETSAQRQARWQAWHDANPNIEVELAAFVRTSSAQSTAYRAQLEALRANPYAAMRLKSSRLTSTQRQQALDTFSNAFALWQSDQFDAAEVLFRRGLDDDPANAAANYYFGDILKRRGQNISAADYMRRAVAFGSNSQQGALAEVALRDFNLRSASSEPEAIRVAPPATFDAPNRPTYVWDCALCPEMVVVPAASFTVDGGYRVTLPAPLAVGRFEVTFEEWDACVQGGGCESNRSPGDGGWGRVRRPVIHVSWFDAQEYVTWLSRTTGKPYRLLFDAEWLHAARAGTTTAYWWGNDIGVGNENCGNCGGARSRQTTTVGSFGPNPFGLYDTVGNVSEWMQDCPSRWWLVRNQDNGSVGEQPDHCANRIIAGGNWQNDLDHRQHYGGPGWENRNSIHGFRVARALT